jgi:hypothetical protein
MARHKMLGSVDLLGLETFGQGRGLNPIWGALIGGGTSSLTSLALGHMTTGKAQQNRQVIGLAAGLAVAGGMYAMKSTRHAAIGAAVGAFLATGLAWLEKKLFGTVQMPAATAAAASNIVAQAQGGPGTSGMGISRTRALNGGFGISTTRALNGGMGISALQQRPIPANTIPGVAGPRLSSGGPPINLMGPQTQASRQVSLMGGPAIHSIAGHYGATHFSHG